MLKYTCTKCEVEKGFEEMCKDKGKEKGIRSLRKVCENERRKKYRESHQDKIKEQRKEYYKDHKEEMNQKTKEWRKENPEKVKETNAKSRTKGFINFVS